MNISARTPDITDSPNSNRGKTDAALREFSSVAPDVLFERLGSSRDGLSEDEAAERLTKLGPNRVTRERKPSILEEIWLRARNPLNALLTTLAVVSYSWATSGRRLSSGRWWCWRSPRHSSRSIAPTKPPPGSRRWSTPPPASCASRATQVPAPTILRRDPGGGAGSGRYRAAVGRRHDPGRPAPARAPRTCSSTSRP